MWADSRLAVKAKLLSGTRSQKMEEMIDKQCQRGHPSKWK